MQDSDITDVLLAIIVLKLFESWMKVVRERANINMAYSFSDGNNSTRGKKLKIAPEYKLATSTPRMRSEIGRKIVKEQFVQDLQNLSTSSRGAHYTQEQKEISDDRPKFSTENKYSRCTFDQIFPPECKKKRTRDRKSVV